MLWSAVDRYQDFEGKYRLHLQGGSERSSYSVTLKKETWYQSLLFTNECTSDFLKNNIKIYIKIATTCFGAVTPSSGSSLSVLAKVTLC